MLPEVAVFPVNRAKATSMAPRKEVRSHLPGRVCRHSLKNERTPMYGCSGGKKVDASSSSPAFLKQDPRRWALEYLPHCAGSSKER